MDGVAYNGLARKQVDLGAFRKNEGIELSLHRGIRNLGQATLAITCERKEQKDRNGENLVVGHGMTSRTVAFLVSDVRVAPGGVVFPISYVCMCICGLRFQDALY